MGKSARFLEYLRVASAGGIVATALASLFFNAPEIHIGNELNLSHVAAVVGGLLSVLAIRVCHRG